MRILTNIFRKIKSPATGLLLLFWLLNFSANAQQINTGDAVIAVAPGTFLTTEGGITIPENGAIENKGTLEIGGDWINNGRGLTSASTGEIILAGKNQVS